MMADSPAYPIASVDLAPSMRPTETRTMWLARELVQTVALVDARPDRLSCVN